MSIGERLSDLIFEKRITQKKAAQDLNIAPSTLSGYIREQREPDIEILKKLADYFNISIDDLVGHNTKMTTEANGKLSGQEAEIIHSYRRLTEDQQEFMLLQINILLSQNAKKAAKSSATISKTAVGRNKA